MEAARQAEQQEREGIVPLFEEGDQQGEAARQAEQHDWTEFRANLASSGCVRQQAE